MKILFWPVGGGAESELHLSGKAAKQKGVPLDAGASGRPFRTRLSQNSAAELTHDPRPMPAEMMVAQRAKEVQHHATMAGFSEVGLHGGKLS